MDPVSFLSVELMIWICLIKQLKLK